MSVLGVLTVAALAGGAVHATEKTANVPPIQFQTERPGVVSINLYQADGTLAKRLIRAERMAAGPHVIQWDGRDEDGAVLRPGDYVWRGIIHDGVGLKLRGWAGNSGATPWPTPDGRGDWGGDTGVPSAVAADEQKVYLGWSMADRGKSILACDLEGRVQWSHRRAEGPSGCQVLCVDDGVVFVLGGLAGVGAEGGCIYRLDAKNGKPLPWPNGILDLKIADFWPKDASAQPKTADAMAVRHDRIYLTFTKSEFMTVLDAKTGAYLQTVVGLPPGKIDVAPTKTNLPDDPNKVVDADFALIEVGNGLLGKVLFAHDPLWVVTSVAVPMNTPLPIAALTIVGDAGQHHRHHAFIGLGAPYHVVQARSLLDTDEALWMGGKLGGRPETGPWQPNSLRDIRAVALAADGKLWVAEGGGFPKRFSVWDTTGEEGKLVREFFGPTSGSDGPGAINPLDPDLMFAQGSEWRIDRQTGRAACLGTVVTRPARGARYAVGENGNAYLVIGTEDGIDIHERVGDGDYRLRGSIYSSTTDRVSKSVTVDQRSFFWADENGDGLMQPEEQQTRDGRLNIFARSVLQDLTFSCWIQAQEPLGYVMRVRSWSPCGAPRYDLLQSEQAPAQSLLSADGKLALFSDKHGASPSSVLCVALQDKRPRWTLPKGMKVPYAVGTSAYMPPPVGNIWLLDHLLINEDGFELGSLPSRNDKAVPWPNSATIGGEMVDASRAPGFLTQAADGKLYLPAGDSAAWNLEVTGLESAKAIPGGTITLP